MKKQTLLTLALASGLIAGQCLSVNAATVVKKNTSEAQYQEYDDSYSDDNYSASEEITIPVIDGATPAETVSIIKNAALNNVIHNHNGLTVTLTKYYFKESQLYLDITVENSSDRYYLFDVANVLLDGFDADTVAYIHAPAGQTITDSIRLYAGSDIKRYFNIANVSEIQFEFEVADYSYYSYSYYDYYDELNDTLPQVEQLYWTTNPVKFKTSETQSSVRSGGTVLYHENGVKIVKKDLFVRNYGSADVHAVLYVENNSGKYLYLSSGVAILNNYDMSPSLSLSLPAGARGIAHMTIPEHQTEIHNILKTSDIKKLEASFSLTFSESWDDYYYSYNGEAVRTPMTNLLK